MLVDDRLGSRELCKPLCTMGVPAKILRLDYADVSFQGLGPHGPVRVAVERKTVGEILSEGHGGAERFARRQLPGLLAHYDYVWLMVEGYTTIDPHSGILMSGRYEAGFGPHRHLYSNYKKRLLSVAIRAGVHVETTQSFRESVHFLHTLYEWWQKPYASHKSILHVDRTETEVAILDERTIKRQVLAQLPGVGWERSKQVAKYFPTLAEAFAADARSWQAALGIEKGMKIAETIVQAIRGTSPRDAKGQ